MKRMILAIGVTIGLGMPGVGHAAGTLYTFGHTTHYPEDQYVDCIAQNFNTSPQTVTIDVLDAFGAVANSTGPVPVAAGQAIDIVLAPGFPVTTACRFTVTGSVKKWRAAAMVFGNDFMLRTIVEGK